MSPVESAYARYTEDKYSNDLGGQLVKAADLATLAANYGSEKRLAEARQKDFLRLYETNKKNEQLSKARYDAWMDAMKREEDALRLLEIAKREIKHLEDTALETRNTRDKTESSLWADLNAANRQVWELQDRLKAIEARSLEIERVETVTSKRRAMCKTGEVVEFWHDANNAIKPQPGERIAIIPAVAKTPVVDELQECIDAVRAVYPNAFAVSSCGGSRWAIWNQGEAILHSWPSDLLAWKAAKNNLPKPVSDDEKFVKEHYPNASMIVRPDRWFEITSCPWIATSNVSIEAVWKIAADWIRGENEKKQLDEDITFVRKVFPSAKSISGWGYHSVVTNGTHLSYACESVLDSWKEARKYTEKMTLPPVAKV